MITSILNQMREYVEANMTSFKSDFSEYDDERKIVSEDETNKRSEAQILLEIRECAANYPSYLSNREGYARGYRDAMMRAHKIVESMITGEPFEE